MAELTSVIFDLEGTLIDGIVDLRNAVNMVLARHGRRALSRDQVAAMSVDGVMALVQKALEETGGAVKDPLPIIQETVAALRSLPADPEAITPGAHAALTGLRAQGIKIGLCTNKPEAATRKLLDEINLTQFFDGVAGGDTFMVHKPNPGHVRGLLDMMGVAPSGSVMVGDGSNDYLAATGAGLPCIMIGESSGQPGAATIPTLETLFDALGAIGFAVKA